MTNLQNSMVQKKDFTVAILLWLFLGGVAGHRVYVKGQVHAIFWYWLAIMFSFGIILIYDVCTLKKSIEDRHMQDEMKEQYLRNRYSQN